jgi:hypothetical protein
MEAPQFMSHNRELVDAVASCVVLRPRGSHLDQSSTDPIRQK